MSHKFWREDFLLQRRAYQPLVRKVERPPSTPITWPVIQPASGESKSAAIAAISSGSPKRWAACIAAIEFATASLLVSVAASGVRVNDGAMQFTLIFGASSAASARVNPSMAPLAIDTEAWAANPCATATVENSKIELVACALALSSGTAICAARNRAHRIAKPINRKPRRQDCGFKRRPILDICHRKSGIEFGSKRNEFSWIPRNQMKVMPRRPKPARNSSPNAMCSTNDDMFCHGDAYDPICNLVLLS
jgi:hypothetical protein